MRFSCDCGAKIGTLKNMTVEESNFRKLGAYTTIRGQCSKCGKKYAFIPYLLDPEKIKKGSHNWKTIMFARHLADKLGVTS